MNSFMSKNNNNNNCIYYNIYISVINETMASQVKGIDFRYADKYIHIILNVCL